MTHKMKLVDFAFKAMQNKEFRRFIKVKYTLY